MAQDAVINGTTYPAVEAVALTDGNGNVTQYYPDAVRYVAQSLTDAQKAQARENIGAISEVDVPVKGVDYWTAADQEDIVQQVIAALGTPVFGRVDADNNIILTGELADGTYTVKYEDAEGNVTDVGIISHVVKEEIINQIPISTDTNGAIFDGDGIKTDTRLNSSGTETTLTGTAVTGYIPVKFNDVVRFKNINYKPEVNSSGNYIALYTPSYAKIESVKDTGMTSAWNYLFGDRVLDDSGRLIEFRFADGSKDYGYIRVSAEGLNAESIITINQPIE